MKIWKIRNNNFFNIFYLLNIEISYMNNKNFLFSLRIYRGNQ